MGDTTIHYTILISKGPVREDGSLGQDGLKGMDGLDGDPGINSKQNNTGQDGLPGRESGWFNKKCVCATDGTHGADGVSGGVDGTDGGNGSSPPLFILKVDTFELPEGFRLNIQGRGGNGGRGGDGGIGGAGASGGKAGTNVDDCIQNGKCQPANGGRGGNGASGGKGGKGGDAGVGGNISISYVNQKCVNQIVPYYQGGDPGEPGNPGNGGDGGTGGQNEIFPRASDPTFASKGDDGPQKGNGGGGNTANPGKYILTQVDKIPPISN